MSDPWGPRPEGEQAPEGEQPAEGDQSAGGQPAWGQQPPTGGQPPGWPGQPPGPGQPGPPAGAVPGYPGQPAYGYGPPVGYYPPARETEQSAVVALVLSIVAWAVCPIVLAVVALVVAGSAERNIAASGGAKEGAGLAKAARIISWVNIAFYGAFLVIGLLVLIVAVATTSST